MLILSRQHRIELEAVDATLNYIYNKQQSFDLAEIGKDCCAVAAPQLGRVDKQVAWVLLFLQAHHHCHTKKAPHWQSSQ